LRILCITLLLTIGASTLGAQVTTIDFEQFASGTVITNQIPGLNFSHTSVLVAGVSLNPSFPPHSGTRVVFDSGGPIGLTITFSPPVTRVSGFFTHGSRLTMVASDSGGHPVATAISAFNNNVVGGDAGSSPNEQLAVAFGTGIASVTITANVAGNSFTLDDLTLTQTPTAVGVPSLGVPALIALALMMAGAGAMLLRRSRHASV
jgi:hypothetical protein